MFCTFLPFPPFSNGTNHFPDHFQSKTSANIHCLHNTCLFHFFSLRLHPPQIQKGEGILHMPINFPIGPRPCLSQKGGGGGGMCLKCPPPLRFTYDGSSKMIQRRNHFKCSGFGQLSRNCRIRTATLSHQSFTTTGTFIFQKKSQLQYEVN